MKEEEKRQQETSFLEYHATAGAHLLTLNSISAPPPRREDLSKSTFFLFALTIQTAVHNNKVWKNVKKVHDEITTVNPDYI